MASTKTQDHIKGSISNPDTAQALIDLIDNFNAALVKMDADAVVLAEMKASINAVNAKLDADAGVTDVDFASLHDVAGVVSSDYVSTLDVAE